MRARPRTASVRVAGPRLMFGSFGGGEAWRKLSVSCIATLLMCRLANRAAAEKSVHDRSGVEQIGERGYTPFVSLCERLVLAGRFPIGPAGRDQ
jgi:hypothetical protein